MYVQTLAIDMFLDGPNGRPKDAVHMLFAGEGLGPPSVTPAPDVTDSEPAAQFQVLSLSALVQMKLNSFRLKDRVHLLDLIDVGLGRSNMASSVSADAGGTIATTAGQSG